jgi:hypothetical protein
LKALLFSLIGLAQLACADSFFDADGREVTHLQITADFTTLRKQRDKSGSYPGLITMDSLRLPVTISVRGNNRLQRKTCKYPPLRLAFDKGQRKDTVFASHKELKLVVMCRDARKYADFLRKEFLTYKAYSKLSSNSFQVHWLDVDYISDTAIGRDDHADTGTPAIVHSAPGFLIEQKKRMAKRTTLKQVPHPDVKAAQLDAYAALIVDLFQYMIGNTDYSLVTSGSDDDCCHNTKLMSHEDSAGFLPVPYDFDNAGLVDASYAQPTHLVPVQRVTQRYYRGFCLHLTEMDAATAKFTQHREEIIQLFRDDKLLSPRAVRRSVKYLNEFFDLITDEDRRKRAIRNRCR